MVPRGPSQRAGSHAARQPGPSKRPAPSSAATTSPTTPRADLRARERAEALFVEGVFHHQSKRYHAALRSFDRLLALQPDPDLGNMTRRWRAKSAAEVRGECQPGFVRRELVRPAPSEVAGQGPTYLDECVPLR